MDNRRNQFMEIEKNNFYSEVISRFALLNRAFRKYSNKVTKNILDSDAVHDLRVTIRRFLTLIELITSLEPTIRMVDLHKDLKKIIKRFNKIRDLQVQLELTKLFTIEELRSISFTTSLEDGIFYENESLRKFFKKGKLIEIEGRLFFRYLNVKNILCKIDFDASKFFAVGRKQYLNLSKQISLIEKNNYPTYHKARLEFKKFRYLMEIFQSIFQIELLRMKDLQEIQSVLGRIQDHWVFHNLLRDYVFSKYQTLSIISDILSQNLKILKQLEDVFTEILTNKMKFWKNFFE